MPTPGIHITTVASPALYTQGQLDQAALIAHALDRGKLVLAIPPDGKP